VILPAIGLSEFDGHMGNKPLLFLDVDMLSGPELFSIAPEKIEDCLGECVEAYVHVRKKAALS